MFDGEWYLRRNEDVAALEKDPLAHFVDFGWAEGRWPNRYFDPNWYRLNNPDVAEARVDPLLHYIRNGDAEGRKPHPLFDPGWYCPVYAPEEDQTVLGHFLAHRKSGRVAPNPALLAVPHIPLYAGDVVRGGDPFEHYLDDLAAGGLEPIPDIPVVAGSGLLDANYYLINAEDVHEANKDPVDHYCRFGWLEDRKPNIYFDPVWYKATSPEVARLGMNPLVHYILIGEAADRRPVPFFDPGWYRAEYSIPADQTALGHYLLNRRKQTVSPNPHFDLAWYLARFGGDLGPNRDPFAHYLQVGTVQDIDPSKSFDAADYRRRNLGKPSHGFARNLHPEQHNPLIHYLVGSYKPKGPASG